MHYVILGNGVAGATAAFTLRQRDAAARITMISGESDYFFSRTALMYAFMDRMSPRDLEPYERGAYDTQRIERRRGWVAGLDAGSRILSLTEGGTVPYDKLLLATGSIPARVPWKGIEKVSEGITHFVSLQHLAECERLTPTTHRAVVVGGGLIGIELVECLLHHGVEVDFLVREPFYWPVAFNAAEAAVVEEQIRRHGVRLRLEEEIEEISANANGRISRVTTNRGNAIPCEMLGVCIGVKPNVEWLRSAATPPAIGRGIQVSGGFRTSLPDVWAAGDCAEIAVPGLRPFVEQIWYSAKRQGELAAHSMLGDEIAYQPPLFYNSAKFFDVEYTTVGQVNGLPEDAGQFFHRFPGKDVTIRIAERAGSVTGFNLLGSRWNHRVLEGWVRERRPMDFVIAHLHRAQFDVEFGRLDLASMRTAYAQWRQSAAPLATETR